jgi:hypothetical protein
MKFPKRYLVGVVLLGVLAGWLGAIEASQPSVQKHGVAKASVSAEWVAEEGARFGKSPTVTADAIKFSAKAKLLASGANPTEGDIQALAYRVMQQASAQNKADLKAMMADMKKTNEEKKAQREAAEKSMQPHKPASQVGQLRDSDEILLQQAKDRQSRLDKMIADGAKPRR